MIIWFQSQTNNPPADDRYEAFTTSQVTLHARPVRLNRLFCNASIIDNVNIVRPITLVTVALFALDGRGLSDSPVTGSSSNYSLSTGAVFAQGNPTYSGGISVDLGGIVYQPRNPLSFLTTVYCPGILSTDTVRVFLSIDFEPV